MSEDRVLTDVPALSIRGLCKSYGKRRVIRDIDLAVSRGEVFGYIGRNGTGKSTTIGCIVGLKPFKDGRILIDGRDVRLDATRAKRELGYVPSEPSCYEMMTGREFLSFTASAFGIRSADFDRMVQELVGEFEFNIADLDRKIGQYSLGMKQKISLMSALVHDPLLWVLDEPTIGLDAVATQTLIDVIDARRRDGKSVFITSHSIELVAKVCDRVAILKDGTIDRIVNLKAGDTYGDLKRAYDSLPSQREDCGR